MEMLFPESPQESDRRCRCCPAPGAARGAAESAALDECQYGYKRLQGICAAVAAGLGLGIMKHFGRHAAGFATGALIIVSATVMVCLYLYQLLLQRYQRRSPSAFSIVGDASSTPAPPPNICITSTFWCMLCEAVLAAIGCETFQLIFHSEFCNWMFRCGCVWTWSGGWKNCNIWNSTGPRCPWCLCHENVSWTADCLVLATMILSIYEAKLRKLHPVLWPLSAIAVFLIVGLVVGFCFKVSYGYPYFVTGPIHGRHDHNHAH